MYISAQLKSKPALYPVQYKAKESYEPAWMLKCASAGAPNGPFLLIQTAGPHTPYLLLTLPEALWLPMVLSMALGFPFAESTASYFICLFSRSATPITKENLCLTDELWERWYTGQRKKIRIPLGKFFNLNLTQTEMPHMGSLLGEEGNSIALINKVVRESFLGRDKFTSFHHLCIGCSNIRVLRIY